MHKTIKMAYSIKTEKTQLKKKKKKKRAAAVSFI